MFYRLYNRFETGLFLDDVKFNVTSGVEMIGGSGVYETRTFEPAELDAVLEAMRQTPLPIDLDDGGWQDYDNRVLAAVLRLMASDYLEQGAARKLLSRFLTKRQEAESARDGYVPLAGSNEAVQDNDAALDNSATSVLSLRLPALDALDESQTNERFQPQANSPESGKLTDHLGAIRKMFTIFDFHDDPLGRTSEILLASPGLYLDAIVGARPSTEPYSEERREQEVRMRKAEVFAKESEGIYQRAQATRIANLSSVNLLTGYLPDPDGKGLTLSLELPLQPGDWEVLLNGEQIGHIDHQWSFRRLVKVTFDKDEPLQGREDQLRMLELVDSSSDGPHALIRFSDAPYKEQGVHSAK